MSLARLAVACSRHPLARRRRLDRRRRRRRAVGAGALRPAQLRGRDRRGQRVAPRASSRSARRRPAATRSTPSPTAAPRTTRGCARASTGSPAARRGIPGVIAVDDAVVRRRRDRRAARGVAGRARGRDRRPVHAGPTPVRTRSSRPPTLLRTDRRAARARRRRRPLLDDEMDDQAAADLARAEMISMPVVLVLLLVVFGGLVAAGLPRARHAGRRRRDARPARGGQPGDRRLGLRGQHRDDAGPRPRRRLRAAARLPVPRGAGGGARRDPGDRARRSRRPAGRSPSPASRWPRRWPRCSSSPTTSCARWAWPASAVVLLDLRRRADAAAGAARRRRAPDPAADAPVGRGAGRSSPWPGRCGAGRSPCWSRRARCWCSPPCRSSDARFADPDERSLPASSAVAAARRDRRLAVRPARGRRPGDRRGPRHAAPRRGSTRTSRTSRDLDGVRSVVRPRRRARADRGGRRARGRERRARWRSGWCGRSAGCRRPAPVQVTGDAAELVDYEHGAARPGCRGRPGSSLLATFVLLFLFTGSVVLPLKAIADEPAEPRRQLRRAGLGVPGGPPRRAGRHRGARQPEHHDAGARVRDRVRPVDGLRGVPARPHRREPTAGPATTTSRSSEGLRRTGGVITAAALLMVVVFAGFVAGGFSPVKQVGLGLVLAVAGRRDRRPDAAGAGRDDAAGPRRTGGPRRRCAGCTPGWA